MGGDVVVEIHGHEPGQLDETGIDPAEGAGIARRHRGDDVALEPFERARGGKPVDGSRIDAGIDRSTHQGHASGLGGVALRRHQRHRRQHRHRGLAHRDDVQIGRELPHECDHQIDVIVQVEAAIEHRYFARIGPIRDVDVMVLEQRFHGPAQQRGEMARERRHHQDARPRMLDVLLFEVEQRAKGMARHHRFADIHGLVGYLDALDAEVRAFVPHAGARHHLAGGGGAAHHRMIGEKRPGL